LESSWLPDRVTKSVGGSAAAPSMTRRTLLRRAEMAYELLADELDLPANA